MVGPLLRSAIDFYELLIFAYIIMSWLRPSGFLFDVYRTLGTICEPWLGIFRRVIPPIGMIDISPMVALLALGLVSQLIRRVLG